MSGRTSLRVGASTHPGNVRSHNEDAFLLSPEHGFFAVIDGIGGQNAGEKAAALAQQELQARLVRKVGTLEQALREAITTANNKIYEAAQQDERMAGMACVLSVAVIEGNQLYLGHVGDSRVYRLRGKVLEKLTHDHSPVGEREDRGELTELEAMRHPRRNEVYRDVGSELHDPHDEEFIEVIQTNFESEDALLLCSDGLSDLVTLDRMRTTLLQHAQDPEAAAAALIKLALSEGGKDNVTVVVIAGARFGQEKGRPSRAEEPTHRLGVIPGALDGQNPRLSGEQTGRMGSGEESPARNFKVISNPLRTTRERLLGEGGGATGFLKGKPGGQASEGTEPAATSGRLRNTDDETTGRRSARVIPLPGQPGSSRAEEFGEQDPRSTGRILKKPSWLATLPGWVPPLLLMVMALSAMGVYTVNKWPSSEQPSPTPKPPQQPIATETPPSPVYIEVSANQKLQEQLDTAKPGSVLLITGGSIKGPLTINKSLSLINIGTDPTELTVPAGSLYGIQIENAGSVVISGLKLTMPSPDASGPSPSPGVPGILLKGSTLTLLNTQFEGGFSVGVKHEESTLLMQGNHFSQGMDMSKGIGASKEHRLNSFELKGKSEKASQPAGTKPTDAPGKSSGQKK